MKTKVIDFLKRHNLYADDIDMEQYCNSFLKEMTAGLNGKDSFLPMIPSYCSPEFSIQKGQSVIVIDAGGTNFRTCLVTFSDDYIPGINNLRKTGMPGIAREVSASEFYSTIVDETERLMGESDRIGFCFSYAAEILPSHDGVPIMFSKEIKAPEVIGKKLGENILLELEKRGYDVSSKRVMILNDTVATLLAGLSMNADKKYDGCIGFILGTGTNTAYIEKNSNIGKLCSETQGTQIINVESGNMDIVLGDIDREFLLTTKDPSKYHFEKMISGAYLGPLCHRIISKAAEEGLFSDSFCKSFKALDVINTIQMSNFIEEGKESVLDDCVKDNAQDSEILAQLIDSHIKRSACLAAINLASVIIKADAGKTKPVLINADGSTYYKTEGLRNYTEKYLHEFLAKKGLKAVFTQIENSPTIGAAIGGLCL